MIVSTLSPLDHTLLLGMVLAEAALDRWLIPPFFRGLRANVPGMRLRGYAVNAVLQWTVMGCIAALWIVDRRPWSALYLGSIDPVRVAVGLTVPVAYVGLAWWQARAILAKPDGKERLRRQFSALPPFFPQTSVERLGFLFTSLTAGVCEEVIFRGFMMWYFTSLAGLWLGVLGSSVLFWLAHLYLGRGPALRAGVTGLVMAAIVLATHSLWPAIVLHATLDAVAGELAYLAHS